MLTGKSKYPGGKATALFIISYNFLYLDGRMMQTIQMRLARWGGVGGIVGRRSRSLTLTLQAATQRLAAVRVWPFRKHRHSSPFCQVIRLISARANNPSALLLPPFTK